MLFIPEPNVNPIFKNIPIPSSDPLLAQRKVKSRSFLIFGKNVYGTWFS